MKPLAHDSLTPREIEVLQTITDLQNYDDVADRLCMSKHTVKTHVNHIYQKWNLNSQLAIVIKGLKDGIVTLQK